jgi:5-methylcytosine-specific restriction enzyme A
MSLILKSPCSQPGCSELVKGGGRCPQHRGAWRLKANVAHKPKRIYNLIVWKRLRALILAGEPTCRACRARGVIRIAITVDHIVDVSCGGAPFDSSNLQPLCETCHNRKTAKTFGFGRRGASPSLRGAPGAIGAGDQGQGGAKS